MTNESESGGTAVRKYRDRPIIMDSDDFSKITNDLSEEVLLDIYEGARRMSDAAWEAVGLGLACRIDDLLEEKADDC